MRMKTGRKPYSWVPSLYFAEALPYVAVMSVATIMYKTLGLSNAELALYTSWLYLPWVIKPLWSPFVDALKTKRWWILAMQILIGAGFAAIAFTIQTSFWLQATLAFFWLVAFSSATHDIAADGFYILALDSHDQAFYVGIRSTFYRIATIFGQGALVMLAGWVKNGAPLGIGDDARLLLKPGDVSMGWLVTFALMALIFMGAFAYHRRVLPHPSSDSGLEKTDVKVLANELWLTIKCFFSKPQILAALAFMLLFRFPEAMLVKLASPFMLDGLESGGLGLDTAEVGFVYGTVGVVGLTLGGILGGMAVSRGGLKRWLWPMVLAISFPDAVYIYLSYFQESGMFVISSCVFVEQFGYGFGFTAYMLYLIYFSRGEKSTSVYAFCTGLMALGMMLPGMMAGWIQEQIGYRMFFVLVMVCTLITVAVSGLLKIDPEFGRKKN
jgi:PAT family beta-lactamase induction signal transducer AmpG